MNERLKDGHGRVVEYLRLSITDRCNLRCQYCMPPGGVDLSPKCEILRYKDFLRLVEVFAGLGVRKIRITGGEPLVRKGVVGFIRQINHIDGVRQVALTTNGTQLRNMAGALKDAGVERVNISLDTLKRDKFKKITGYDGLSEALDGIEAAIEAGFEAVKVNMVVIAGVNDDEVEDFANLSRKMKVQIRFIEFMPATPQVWDKSSLLPMDQIKSRVEKLGEMSPCVRSQWGGPAQIFRFDGSLGEVGFISSVTNHFCDTCNRLRLTSTGELLTCLFAKNSLDLKTMLRAGATDRDIEEAVIGALRGKNAIREMDPAALASGRSQTMSSVGG